MVHILVLSILPATICAPQINLCRWFAAGKTPDDVRSPSGEVEGEKEQVRQEISFFFFLPGKQRTHPQIRCRLPHRARVIRAVLQLVHPVVLCRDEKIPGQQGPDAQEEKNDVGPI